MARPPTAINRGQICSTRTPARKLIPVSALDGELFVIGRNKDLIIICGENIYPHDVEEIVFGHPAIHDGRTVAMGVYDPDLSTEEIMVVADVENEELPAKADEIERELRNRISAVMGVTARMIFVKPPKWIVKSTAGKPSRSAMRQKLFSEHQEFAQARSH